MSTTSRPPATIEDLVASIQTELNGPFEQMAIAEEEIEKATADHPQATDRLYHSFSLLRPTAELMTTQFVYRGHVREVLARVAAGQDTRPGTAAEVCLVTCEVSQRVPLSTAAAGLYTRMWQQAFADLGVAPMPHGEHYEALAGPEIDELETTTRAQIGKREAWRHLAAVTCPGRHHGVAVECGFAPPAARPRPTALAG